MATLATLREQVEALYIGYLNRAPDPEGLSFWMNAANSGLPLAAIAQSFSVQDETRAIYGELSAIGAGGSATAQDAFMRLVYANLFGRTEVDAAGMTFWRAQLNSGASVGSIIMNIISGAQGNDAVVVSNKLVVADYFTTQLVAKNATFSLEAAKTAFANVTASPASITTALANVDTAVSTLLLPPVVTPPPVVVDAPPPPALPIEGDDNNNTLTGTPNADVINGLGGNDTINGLAGADTLNGGDGDDTFLFNTGDVAAGETLNGGDDTDTLSVVTSTSFTGLATPTLLTEGSIEQILIASGQAATFTGAQLAGQAVAVNATTVGSATLTIIGAGTQDFSGLTFNAFGTNDAFDSAVDRINIFTSDGADDITGTSISDALISSKGADSLNGGGGNDVFFYVGDPDITAQAAGDTLDGGAGLDGVLAYFSTDFRGLTSATLTDAFVERIFIKTKGGGDGFDFDAFAIFNGSQLHNQAITVNSYNDPNVTDGARIAALSIFASGGDNDFSQLGFDDASTTEGFDAYDGRVFITGSAGADTITGTSRTDFFFKFSTGDVMNGGSGGNNTFVFQSGDDVTGVTVNGGSGTDHIFATVTTDFTTLNGGVPLTDNSIDVLTIDSKGPTAVTAIVDGKQLSGQDMWINSNNQPDVTDTDNVATLTINVTTSSADFSSLKFEQAPNSLSSAFVSGTDILNIFTGAGADDITGTSVNDRIFSSLGADTLNGGGGDDLFTYFGSFSSTVTVSGDPAVDQALGDTLNGGAGSDAVLAYYSTDFRGLSGTPTLTSLGIERIFIRTKGDGNNPALDFDTYATFNGSQLHNQAIIVNSFNDPALADTGKFGALYIHASGVQDFSQLIFTDSSDGAGVEAFTPTTTGDRIFIVGSAGDDNITGTSSHDLIYGEVGADTLTGGSGFDGFGFNGAAGGNASGITTGETITDFVDGTDRLFFYNVTEVVSGQQADVQTAVAALVTPTAADIATAMATANTTDLGVSSAVFGSDTYVYFERTGSGTGVAVDDVFIKLTGVASGFTFAGDIITI